MVCPINYVIFTIYYAWELTVASQMTLGSKLLEVHLTILESLRKGTETLKIK